MVLGLYEVSPVAYGDRYSVVYVGAVILPQVEFDVTAHL